METYDEIYNRMKSAYEQESGNTFNEASDIAIRLKVLAGEIYNTQINMEWMKRQMFAESATGECLNKLAVQRGIERKPAQKSVGELTFFISEPVDHDIHIPRGTVAATLDDVPVRYVTTENEEIASGNTLVSIYAEAEEAGSRGNVGIGKVVAGVSMPAEIERVSNREQFAGGTDEETDEQLRNRIRDSYLRLPNGTNSAYYEQLALTVNGISKACAAGKTRGAGTVDVFVSGNGERASSQAVAEAQALISGKRELNVDVRVESATMVEYDLDVIVYKKSQFSADEVREKCDGAFREYVNSLDIGAKLFLSGIGKALLDTECIGNYEFSEDMEDITIGKSQCLTPGSVRIVVR